MTATGTESHMWVRVGGGMESVPDRKRHGPADTAFPPPGGPWEPLALGGRLVGWAEHGGLATARRSAEMGARLAEEERTYLVGRLGHKLRSAVLALQESARQAAFGRPELLETVFEQAQEVGRRAAALEAASTAPKERPRGVVVGVSRCQRSAFEVLAEDLDVTIRQLRHRRPPSKAAGALYACAERPRGCAATG